MVVGGDTASFAFILQRTSEQFQVRVFVCVPVNHAVQGEILQCSSRAHVTSKPSNKFGTSDAKARKSAKQPSVRLRFAACSARRISSASRFAVFIFSTAAFYL